MQKPRSHSVQQRRRWSDWSECSASCLKTRHRLNCDDILAQNSTQKVAAKSESTSLDKRDTSGGLGESEDELLLKADQIEEDDYADEGDEDEEKDSCDNVDPRKTYEEIGCIGGQCKYSGQAPSEQRQPMAAMSPRLKQHHRLKELMVSGRGQDPRLLSQGDKDVQQTTHLFGGKLEPRARYDNTQPIRFDQTPPTRGQKGAGNNLQYLANKQQTSANQTKGQSAEVNTLEGSGTIWTQSMWSPQKLLNGDLGPQANLIQWSILIGSLLTIILLIMLLVRKLFVSTFPSYRWMLAKQTLESSSSQFSVADFCQPRSRGQTATSSTTSNQPTISIETDAKLGQVHQVCHPMLCNWPASQRKQPDTSKTARSSSSAYHHVIGLNGKHHLNLSLNNANFNLDRPAYSNSESGIADERDSLVSNYDYDTLNSNYDDPTSIQQGERGSIITQDFVSYRPKSGRSTCKPAAMGVSNQNKQTLREAPGGKSEFSQAFAESGHIFTTNQTNLSDSKSSSISSSDNSPSVQSTTAQMLSNEASSSFEQPLDLGPKSSVTNSDIDSIPVSETPTRPVSLTRKPRTKDYTKLINYSPQSTKTQPNSPVLTSLPTAGQKRSMATQPVRQSNSKQRSGNRLVLSEIGAGQASALVSNCPREGPMQLDGAGSIEREETHYYEEISRPREY